MGGEENSWGEFATHRPNQEFPIRYSMRLNSPVEGYHIFYGYIIMHNGWSAT